MNVMKKCICLTLMVILMVSVLAAESCALPFTATAAEDGVLLELASGSLMVPRIQTDAKTYMIVRYQFRGQPIPGAAFKIYRVADVDAFCEFTAVGAFTDCVFTVNLNNNDQDSWKAMAHNLKPWVTQQGIAPYVTGMTDSVNGDIVFSEEKGNMLKPGLYLLVGDPIVVGDYTYSCSPAMIYLPEINVDENDWEYGSEADPVIIKPKGERGDEPDVVTKLKVIKIWKDYGYTIKRPSSVTVGLLKNGEKVQEVKLSEGNNWRHTFKDLPVYENGKLNEWDITEIDAGKDYKSEMVRFGITYIVKNTYTGYIPFIDNPVLPDTGLLWWPVPVLLGLGALLIVYGTVKRRKAEE